MAKWKAEAANIAAQRDEWKRRAEVAEERLRAVEADLARARRTAKVTDANWRQLAAEIARIRAADRTSITVRTETAAQMRKGQAI